MSFPLLLFIVATINPHIHELWICFWLEIHNSLTTEIVSKSFQSQKIAISCHCHGQSLSIPASELGSDSHLARPLDYLSHENSVRRIKRRTSTYVDSFRASVLNRLVSQLWDIWYCQLLLEKAINKICLNLFCIYR